MEPLTWIAALGVGVVAGAGGFLAGRGRRPDVQAPQPEKPSPWERRAGELARENQHLRAILGVRQTEAGLRGPSLGGVEGPLLELLAEVHNHRGVEAAAFLTPQGLVVAGAESDPRVVALGGLVGATATRLGASGRPRSMQLYDAGGQCLSLWWLPTAGLGELVLAVWNSHGVLSSSLVARIHMVCSGRLPQEERGATPPAALDDAPAPLKQLAAQVPLVSVDVRFPRREPRRYCQPPRPHLMVRLMMMFEDLRWWAEHVEGLFEPDALAVRATDGLWLGVHAVRSGRELVAAVEVSQEAFYPLEVIRPRLKQLLWLTPGEDIEVMPLDEGREEVA